MDFANAVKCLLGGVPRGRRAQIEYVDINVRNDEVELVGTGVSSAFAAQIVSSGYSRVPCRVMEGLYKSLKTLRQASLNVSIETGAVKMGSLAIRHPEISLRPIGSRIADLPINAPLLDVLGLLVRYSPDEIEDSGLGARVLEAQAQVSRMIDRALEALEPLEIRREALDQFLWEQIKARFERKE